MTNYQLDMYARKRKEREGKVYCVVLGGIALLIWVIAACTL